MLFDLWVYLQDVDENEVKLYIYIYTYKLVKSYAKYVACDLIFLSYAFACSGILDGKFKTELLMTLQITKGIKNIIRFVLFYFPWIFHSIIILYLHLNILSASRTYFQIFLITSRISLVMYELETIYKIVKQRYVKKKYTNCLNAKCLKREKSSLLWNVWLIKRILCTWYLNKSDAVYLFKVNKYVHIHNWKIRIKRIKNEFLIDVHTSMTDKLVIFQILHEFISV